MKKDGKNHGLGAILVEGGVLFSLFSKNAKSVRLCLYNEAKDASPERVVALEKKESHIWKVFVPGIGEGQLYGYRVDGPYAPEKGMRFNPNKLLIDPYARAITHKHDWEGDLHYAYDRNAPEKDLVMDHRPNDGKAPKCVVVDDAFDWQGVPRPDIPADRLVLYEVHIKGFTAHPSSGVSKAGTYLGFVERISHLKELGVNAVELLPVHESADEEHLVTAGLSNYWGYSTLGFFAPDSRFAFDRRPGAAVNEFKTLVRECHRAGIEVILDVVYNHTCEGGRLGPSLCFRGIDNASYYLLPPDSPEKYRDLTGCGNTLNLENPDVLRLVMDSLRLWAEEFMVDGFRFDLAPVLGRVGGAFTRNAPFFAAIHQDPILSPLKLIAEPWDLGHGGYRQGHFPIDFHEWNSHFRDRTRRFIKGDAGLIATMGYLLTGSSDLFAISGRKPHHSINLVSSHDGFSLCDLVSYNHKHNEANGEDNRDGEKMNHSRNWGVEGPTEDPLIAGARLKAMKNLMTILLLSQGTPMIRAGDEFAATQGGNNNAYCQDNEISWLDASLIGENRELFDFVKKLIRFRLDHEIFRRKNFFTGKALHPGDPPDIQWYGPESSPPDWHNPQARFLACVLDGGRRNSGGDEGRRQVLMVLNMHDEAVEFTLPPRPPGGAWTRVIDTALPANEDFVLPLSMEEKFSAKTYSMKEYGIAVFLSKEFLKGNTA